MMYLRLSFFWRAEKTLNAKLIGNPTWVAAWEAGAKPPEGGTPAVEAGARPRSPQMIEKIGGRDRDRTGDPLLAKQVLSQLSYTPTVAPTLILKHFRPFQNPFLRFSVIWSEPQF